jgi:hypothetical protein
VKKNQKQTRLLQSALLVFIRITYGSNHSVHIINKKIASLQSTPKKTNAPFAKRVAWFSFGLLTEAITLFI